MKRILILLIIAVSANAADQSLDLERALESHNMQSVLTVLNNDGKGIYTPAVLGKALHSTRSSDFIEFLIMRGADVDAKEEGIKATPLHRAAYEGRKRNVELLLRHNAAVDQADCFGNTALHQAKPRGFTDIVELLLKYRASVNTQNRDGWTVFDWIFWHDCSESDKYQITNLLRDPLWKEKERKKLEDALVAERDELLRRWAKVALLQLDGK